MTKKALARRINVIINATATVFGVHRDMILENDDKSWVAVMPRHVAIYVAWRTTGTSYRKLGATFGVNESSAQRACSGVLSAMEVAQYVSEMVERVEERV